MLPAQFFSKYAIWAVINGSINGIPPSISLSQAALESGYGQYVAGNNLFGIKADSSWSGAKVYSRTTEQYNGQTINQTSAFRAYANSLDSFRDHSVFLKENSRYNGLFDLQLTDYAGWAYGLKSAGYATAANYAPTLISIIEQNDLAKYDQYALYLRYGTISFVAILATFAIIKYYPNIKKII